MIKDLNIKNFKNIQSLEIKNLKQVNLFTGKNNTGKSTLLEALSLYVSNGDTSILYSILRDRGESFGKKRNDLKFIISSLSSLFHGRKATNGNYKRIYVGESSIDLFGENIDYENGMFIDIIKFYEESEENSDGEYTRKRRIIVEDNNSELLNIDTEFALRIQKGESQRILPILPGKFDFRLRRGGLQEEKNNFQFIKSSNLDSNENGKLWDKITLTDKENDVIKGLKIIEPGISRIAFVGESSYDRVAVVRLENSNDVVPLQSMGDGINRILSIVLAAVNSENGILIIDEFENGLHHSVQKDLWKIIFNLAQSLNVQVFVTTHSNDCIEGFEDVLNESENIDGKLIRLERKKEGIRVVEFNNKELQIATDNDIETR